MDNYNNLDIPLLKGTIIKARLSYTCPGRFRRNLELFFMVEDCKTQISLQNLSTFFREEVISRLTKVQSKEVFWSQISLDVPSSDVKITLPITNIYGKRTGNVIDTPFVLDVVPATLKSFRRQLRVYGVSSDFSPGNMQQIYSKKEMPKDSPDYLSMLEVLESLFLFAYPKDSQTLVLRLVVPVKDSKSRLKSKEGKDLRFYTEKVRRGSTNYVYVLACYARGFLTK